MRTVEQCLVEANAIAARLSLYAWNATRAAELGAADAARHWTRRREREEVALEKAKRALADARRRELLRVHPAGGEG